MDARLLKLEHFINDFLREHLRRLYEERNRVTEQASEYLQLKTAIQRLKTENADARDIRLQVDIGSNFYCQAVVKDPSVVYVLAGMGIFVPLSYDDALEFIEEKQKHLLKKIDNLSDRCAEVKARIQMSLQLLRDLQGLPSDIPEPAGGMWD